MNDLDRIQRSCRELKWMLGVNLLLTGITLGLVWLLCVTMSPVKTQTAAPPQIVPPRRPRVGISLADANDARGDRMQALLLQIAELQRET